MLEARLGDGFPTERRTAEAWPAGCLLTLLPSHYPEKLTPVTFTKYKTEKPTEAQVP